MGGHTYAVRGDDDCAVLLGLLHPVPDHPAVDGVQSRGGLIKEQHLDVVAHACQRDAQPPLHPAAVRPGPPVRHRHQVELAENLAGLLLHAWPVLASQREPEVNVLVRGQLVPQHVVLLAVR